MKYFAKYANLEHKRSSSVILSPKLRATERKHLTKEVLENMTIDDHIWSFMIGVISGLTIPIFYKAYTYITCKYPSRKLWKEYISKENYGILSCSDLIIDIDSVSTGMYDFMSLYEM